MGCGVGCRLPFWTRPATEGLTEKVTLRTAPKQMQEQEMEMLKGTRAQG